MRRLVIFIAITLSPLAIATQAQQTLDIREWHVPYEQSRPRDPFAESATSVWFVGQRSGFLANLNTVSGKFEKTDLKPGSGPHNLIVGSDGIVWYAGNRNRLIGRYDPRTKTIDEITMPDAEARDPHTLIFDSGEQNIWFTVQGGNMIGRLHVASRKIDLVRSKTPRSRPYGIKIAPDGFVWVVLFGSNKIVRVDPATLVLEEIELPRPEARPRRLEITRDGRIWYVDYAKGRLGVYDPKSTAITEWQLPQGEDSRPYAMAADKSGRLWMVASGVKPNVFVGFDPLEEAFIAATPIPSGGGTVRHMHYHEASGAVWFGTDKNTIGRAIVEPGKRDSP